MQSNNIVQQYLEDTEMSQNGKYLHLYGIILCKNLEIN